MISSLGGFEEIISNNFAGLLHQDEATRDRCRKLLERIDALCDTEDLTLNSQLSPAFLLLLRSSGDAS